VTAREDTPPDAAALAHAGRVNAATNAGTTRTSSDTTTHITTRGSVRSTAGPRTGESLAHVGAADRHVSGRFMKHA
jgi:hypothetical protein